MNIAIVCYPTFGGSGVVATELGMALAEKGHEIHFISYKMPVRLNFISDSVHYHEVFIEEYPLFRHQPYELALSSKIVEVVEANNIETLHVHYAIPHAYAGYMAKQILKQKDIDLKLITTLHGTDITLVGSHPNYKTAVEFSINNSDCVTTVSNKLKQDTESLFDIKKDIEVIYNFIDMEKYSPKGRCKRHLIARPDQRVIVHVSNFRPVKRIQDVIRCFFLIQEKIDSKLIMVGDGPDKAMAELLAKELGIENKVLFTGNSNEVSEILCFADLFILPSETESFGLSALEAMAAETPVISTNTGGLPEVNIDGQTGYLSDFKDVKTMAYNAYKILKDDDILSGFKKRALKHASTFSIEKIVPLYEKLYFDALKK